MTREDIIRMAREAGYFFYDLTETHGIKTVETDEKDEWAQLERFAVLVAERDKALLRQALEALEYASDITNPQGDDCKCKICVGIAALRERLEEQTNG